MPTLQDILDNDLGLGSEKAVSEKTASQNIAESDEIEKLAMEVGLVDKNDETDSASPESTTGQTKEAQMGLDSLYSQLFPGDADVVGGTQEKVAAQDKEAAAIEEAMGEVAFDHFHKCVDNHITKIAEEMASKKDSPGAPDQALPSNEKKDNEKIDTSPEVQDEAMGTSPKGAVGDFEQKKMAAVRKHMLLAQLNASQAAE